MREKKKKKSKNVMKRHYIYASYQIHLVEAGYTRHDHHRVWPICQSEEHCYK